MANENKIKSDKEFSFYIQKEQVEDFGVVFVSRKKTADAKVYPYVDFHNGGTSFHSVDCDNCDIRYTCPYLKFLEKQDYTDYQVDRMGSITIVHLNFWKNYSAKEKNLPYPKNFVHCVRGIVADNLMLKFPPVSAGFFYKISCNFNIFVSKWAHAVTRRTQFSWLILSKNRCFWLNPRERGINRKKD